MSTRPAIGIDLGTTSSCVGVFQCGRVEITANDQGNRITPSCVAFTGEVASSRLIGHRFYHEAVQSDTKHWPFKVINSKGKAKIQVRHCSKAKQFFAEQISPIVMSKMKETAEAYLGEEVTDAVITVPACFNDNQRNATIDAAKIARLNVLRLINEPTAAAIACGMDRKSERQHSVLIFDWGGGTFDTSIVFTRNREFEVKAVGDGEDINSRLVDHHVEMIKQAHAGKDLTINKKVIHCLKKACETAKRMLTSAEFTKLVVESWRGCCRTSLMVGTQKSISLDEAVANAAAVLAAKLSGNMSKSMENLMLYEVPPLSSGWGRAGGMMEFVIKRNTRIPTKQTCTCQTARDNQMSACMGRFEGERAKASDNFLGELSVKGFPAAPRGEINFKVSYEIYENGILHVSSVGMATGKQNRTTVTKYKARLAEEDVELMLADAKKHKQEDEKERSRVAAMNALLDCIYSTKRKLEKCEESIKWTDMEKQATKEDYERKRKQFESECSL
ncbi:heat shock protein 70 related [Echinococcus multilocularis]|uniref:Heat shock protein 70 related n=1 Tax=Echinococcus multilocularis TaxID=6211 RepID=A0A087VWG6_ECHMU|nr:heat shock protein 70 related [Echinococcus multilocularis]